MDSDSWYKNWADSYCHPYFVHTDPVTLIQVYSIFRLSNRTKSNPEFTCHLFRYMEPLLTKACKQADKVRALCYNHRTQEIAVISPNSYIHCWNALTMKQVIVNSQVGKEIIDHTGLQSNKKDI